MAGNRMDDQNHSQWQAPLLSAILPSGLGSPFTSQLLGETYSSHDQPSANLYSPYTSSSSTQQATSGNSATASVYTGYQYGHATTTYLEEETTYPNARTNMSLDSIPATNSKQSTSDFPATTPIDAIEPSFTIPVASLGKYINTFELEFLDLKSKIFEKQQCRKQKKARQRIIDGKVKIAVKSSREVQLLIVSVRREQQAAKLCKDLNGETLLNNVIKLQREEVVTHDIPQAKVIEYKFQVDLDSVYDGKLEPVYKLARVEMSERNKFQLIAQALFVDQEYSEKVYSEPFLVRTQRSENERPFHNPWKTCPSPYKRKALSSKGSPPVVSEPDSSVAPEGSPLLGQFPWDSPSSASSMDHLIVKHLDAQRANIDELNVTYINTRRGDIAYHVELNDSHLSKDLKEGQVVGFLAAPKGNTTIELLTTENASQAVMAGVITRSAWVQCESPKDELKGKTDIVCIIGMVPVNVVGTVRTGDRIYSSSDYPGCAVPESHLPLGYSFTSRNHTLLGMAMECKSPRNFHETEAMLVKSFVCIVLGINGQQLTKEVEHVLESLEMDVSVKIDKSSKSSCRRTYGLVCGVVLLLALLGAFLYEYLYPGSAMRYWLCRQGSVPGHTLDYLHPNTYGGKDRNVPYIQFTWEELKQKMKLDFPRLKGDDVSYYMNLDVCAYGSTGARTGLPQDPSKFRMGCYVIAANQQCNIVYCFIEFCWKVCRNGRNVTCVPQPEPHYSLTQNQTAQLRNICTNNTKTNTSPEC